MCIRDSYTTVEEVDFAIASVTAAVERLRHMSPLWEMHEAGIDLDTVQWAAH